MSSSPEFKILQVLNSRGGTDEHSLVFKISWLESNEIAFMQFDMARKKYPLVVLDYLAARIKQKPVGSPATGQEGKEAKEVKEKKHVVSPLTQHSDSPIVFQQGRRKETQMRIQDKGLNEMSVGKFFEACAFCDSKKVCSKMLDYDAIVPVDSNVAYPVFFKLPTVPGPAKERRRASRMKEDFKARQFLQETRQI